MIPCALRGFLRWPIAFALFLCCAALPGQDAANARIVFVGDSITDGHTYPQLVRQALADSGRPVPVCINAGVAGDTAAGMRKRLERDVLVHRPTLVTLSVGINDVLHRVSLASYEADVTAIADRLRQEKVPLLLLTTSILGPKHAEADRKLADYNAILRRLAVKYGCKVAEVHEAMQRARATGAVLLEEDQVHPNQEGQQVIARAVLDALGHKDVAVPKELRLTLLPGVVRHWRLRVAPDKAPPLDEKTVQTLRPDETWKSYTLPEQQLQSAWWFEHERQRGFALSLPKLIGKGRSYQGVATIEAEKVRQVFFNTGAHLQTIWLNGERIYRSDGWTGWHAGKERVAAELRAGTNTIVIETGEAFFLSITDNGDW